MFALEIELLGGRYVATAHNDRFRAEWPPHPARLFSALVAALHDHEPVDLAERAALLWLEQQQPPSLDVDLTVDETIGRRTVHSTFVPVNDVTLVGDPEADVREARDKLASLEKEEQTKGVAASVKKARKEMEKQEANFRKSLLAQQSVDGTPAQSAIETAIALLPDRRVRQERTFPVVIPARPTITFLWQDADATDHLEALRRLSGRVTRLGHSSSLVRCAIRSSDVTPSLVPDPAGDHVLRIVGPGQVERLEEAYARHLAVDARVLPARAQRYSTVRTARVAAPRSIWGDDWIVFERIGGARPLASRGVDLAIGLRRMLIEIHGSSDLSPVLSGHASNGGPSADVHLAFVPLPWVNHEHADGSVQGIALIIPRPMPVEEREKLLRLLGRLERERGNPDDDWSFELATPSDVGRSVKIRVRRVEVASKVSLDAARWCRPSAHFTTATPIALDRHPGNLRSNADGTATRAAAEASASIADACERIGLPRPSAVSISLAPVVAGSQHVRAFVPWPRKAGTTRRALVHAEISFSEPVRGPVILGAGRYFGLGICLPITSRR